MSDTIRSIKRSRWVFGKYLYLLFLIILFKIKTWFNKWNEESRREQEAQYAKNLADYAKWLAEYERKKAEKEAAEKAAEKRRRDNICGDNFRLPFM